MIRRRRSLLSFVLASALVFAQLAVSAHACAVAGREAPAVAAIAPSQEQAPAHDCCPQAPADEGGVCSQHCHSGATSVDNVQPVPAAIDAKAPALRLELPLLDAGAVLRRQQRLAPSAAPPPAAILFGVLRI